MRLLCIRAGLWLLRAAAYGMVLVALLWAFPD